MMKRLAVLLAAVALALVAIAPSAVAGNKNAPFDLTWDSYGYTFHGYFQANPNGLMHQWRADDSDLLPGWHFTYQPVGDMWPEADCTTMVYDPVAETMVPNPKFAGSSLYAYSTTGTDLDTVFQDGTDYWVCRYMP
jgi:hypothetical protein